MERCAWRIQRCVMYERTHLKLENVRSFVLKCIVQLFKFSFHRKCTARLTLGRWSHDSYAQDWSTHPIGIRPNCCGRWKIWESAIRRSSTLRTQLRWTASLAANIRCTIRTHNTAVCVWTFCNPMFPELLELNFPSVNEHIVFIPVILLFYANSRWRILVFLNMFWQWRQSDP